MTYKSSLKDSLRNAVADIRDASSDELERKLNKLLTWQLEELSQWAEYVRGP